jgi:hypothetical protein
MVPFIIARISYVHITRKLSISVRRYDEKRVKNICSRYLIFWTCFHDVYLFLYDTCIRISICGHLFLVAHLTVLTVYFHFYLFILYYIWDYVLICNRIYIPCLRHEPKLMSTHVTDFFSLHMHISRWSNGH